MTRIPIALVLSAILALPAAAVMPSPDDLIRDWQSHRRTGFTGKRVQELQRGSLRLHLTGRVTYQDPANFQIRITDPPGMAAMQLDLSKGRSQFFFPSEQLHFDNDNPAAREYAESILSHLTDRPDLLRRNYSLMVMGNDITALTPTVILDAAPRNGYRTPGRRFWLARDSFQILREERRWAANMEPYFTSYYTDFQTETKPAITFPETEGWRHMVLRAGSTNHYRWFPSLPDLRRETGATMPLPTAVPTGFELADVSSGSFYGTRIQVMRYTDGLNNVWTMVRPSSNVFVGLIAGQYSLSLMRRFQDIVYNLPYNYNMIDAGGTWVYTYGDLYPEDLAAMSRSVPVTSPASSPVKPAG